VARAYCAGFDPFFALKSKESELTKLNGSLLKVFGIETNLN